MATVRDVMAARLISVDPQMTVAQAATVMGEHRVGSVVVMDGDRLAGIFTERDIVRALSQDFDAPHGPISHWMTRDPKTIAPDASLQEALTRMLDGGFRHLPVVDGDRPVGMVSMRDVSGGLSDR